MDRRTLLTPFDPAGGGDPDPVLGSWPPCCASAGVPLDSAALSFLRFQLEMQRVVDRETKGFKEVREIMNETL